MDQKKLVDTILEGADIRRTVSESDTYGYGPQFKEAIKSAVDGGEPCEFCDIEIKQEDGKYIVTDLVDDKEPFVSDNFDKAYETYSKLCDDAQFEDEED